MIDLENLTLKQIKEIQNMTQKNEAQSHPYEIGKNYLIRTVTMILTGRLVFIGNMELALEDGAWIADTGRFSESLEDQEKFKEVEPFKNKVIIGRGSIVDCTEITKLIRKMK